MRIHVLAVAALAAIPSAAVRAQTKNADSVRLVTVDISNFWNAVDRAAGDSAALVSSLREVYLRNASPGLTDWIVNRLIDQNAVDRALEKKGWTRERVSAAMAAAPGTAQRTDFDTLVMPALLDNAALNLAYSYRTRRQYYDAIRLNTLAVDTAAGIKDSIRASFRRFSLLYPDAKYADIYFLIGRMNSGGTTGRNTLLIGTEMFGRDGNTPVTGLDPWRRAVTGRIDELPHIVAHEMIHTLQGTHSGRQTLLSAALDEGGADFLSELISGRHIINPAYAYGDAHEAELWARFSREMDSAKTDGWMGQGDHTAPGIPADLGYWMGYKICKAYYDRAADKKAAIRQILLFGDARAFLDASGYGRQHE